MAEIQGTAGNDDGIANPALVGTEDDDTISGLLGDDLLEGLGGNDVLIPGAGADTVRGGAGDDTVIVNAASVASTSLDGGEGTDRLVLVPSLGRGPIKGLLDIDGFERLDMNQLRVTLTPEQLAQVTDLRGLGSEGALWMRFDAGADDVIDLGGIGVGADGMAPGRIHLVPQAPLEFQPGDRVSVVLDASGSASSWEMKASGRLPGFTLIGIALPGFTLIGSAQDDLLIGGPGHTLQGGDGDDRFQVEGNWRLDQWTQIDGGDGEDVFEGREGGDFERVAFTNVEVLESGGTFTGAGIRSFDTLRNMDSITVVTPGLLDLNGKLESVNRDPDGAYRFEIIPRGGPDHVILTDHWARLTVVTRSGNDTVETGRGSDVLDGGAGDDSLLSGDGFDTVWGGPNDDVIVTWATEADGSDQADGGYGNDSISTGPGNDILRGGAGHDTLDGGDGADTIRGDDGDDVIRAGTTEADIADSVSGGAGDDSIDGGAGNDRLAGDDGADTLLGGTGSDTILGGEGDDLLAGGAISDLIFGGDGFDFLNGGFGSDRLNGGAGSDSFYHAGLEGHGSDWIQDFSDAEGDRLVGPDGATHDQFQVNIATTAGAGDPDTAEAFVLYRPTGQILWALVDGAAQDGITLTLNEVSQDLLA